MLSDLVDHNCLVLFFFVFWPYRHPMVSVQCSKLLLFLLIWRFTCGCPGVLPVLASGGNHQRVADER